MVNTPRPASPGGRVSDQMSQTIRVARVTCIFLMMYTHARPYPEFANFPHELHNIILHTLYAIPSLLLGKASVPLLGAVSGWLFALTFKGSWRSNALKKARTVLLPLFLWNALLLIILWSIPALEPRWARPVDALGWLGKFIPLVEYPTNSPLYFLRDLFICMMAAPLLLRWFDAKGKIAMGIAFGASCLFAMVAHEYFVLTRPVILPTFVGGLILARLATDVLSARFIKPSLLAVAAIWCALSLCVTIPLTGTRYIWSPWLGSAPEVLNRFALAYLLWWGVAALARTGAGRTIAALEPYIFFVFCSHHIVQLFAWVLIGEFIQNGAYSPVYPFYFFVQPVLAVLVGIAGYRLLAVVAPRQLDLLVGGRKASPGKRRHAALA